MAPGGKGKLGMSMAAGKGDGPASVRFADDHSSAKSKADSDKEARIKENRALLQSMQVTGPPIDPIAQPQSPKTTRVMMQSQAPQKRVMMSQAPNTHKAPKKEEKASKPKAENVHQKSQRPKNEQMDEKSSQDKWFRKLRTNGTSREEGVVEPPWFAIGLSGGFLLLPPGLCLLIWPIMHARAADDLQMSGKIAEGNARANKAIMALKLIWGIQVVMLILVASVAAIIAFAHPGGDTTSS